MNKVYHWQESHFATLLTGSDAAEPSTIGNIKIEKIDSTLDPNMPQKMNWNMKIWQDCDDKWCSDYDKERETFTISPLQMSLLESGTLLKYRIRTKGIRHVRYGASQINTDYYFLIINDREARKLPLMIGLFCELQYRLNKLQSTDWRESKFNDAMHKNLDKINILSGSSLGHCLLIDHLQGPRPAHLNPRIKDVLGALTSLSLQTDFLVDPTVRDPLHAVAENLYDQYDGFLRTQNQLPDHYYAPNPHFNDTGTAVRCSAMKKYDPIDKMTTGQSAFVFIV